MDIAVGRGGKKAFVPEQTIFPYLSLMELHTPCSLVQAGIDRGRARTRACVRMVRCGHFACFLPIRQTDMAAMSNRDAAMQRDGRGS
jgi:hypothetical protein